MKPPRIVFAGTPDFALASLKALHDAGLTPVAVYTQPDRPSGRGKKLRPSVVKQYAESLGLPVYQPTTLRSHERTAELASLKPDLLVVAAYGLLLPQAVLDVPRLAAVNVHASALPRWRGAAPIQAAILHGDAETGISLMQMTAGLDEGPVYATETLAIADDETAGTLHDRLARLGGELLARELMPIADGSLQPVSQDKRLVTYAGKISTADARLDWSRPATTLARQVRAYNPVPGCFFEVNSIRIKCWSATVLPDVQAEPGTVVSADEHGVVVATADGALCMTELQRPGKGRVNARQFSQALPLANKTLS